MTCRTKKKNPPTMFASMWITNVPSHSGTWCNLNSFHLQGLLFYPNVLCHGPCLSLWVFRVWLWARGQCKGITFKTVNRFTISHKGSMEFLTKSTFALDMLKSLRLNWKLNTNFHASFCFFLNYYYSFTTWRTQTAVCCHLSENVHTISSNPFPFSVPPSLKFGS